MKTNVLLILSLTVSGLQYSSLATAALNEVQVQVCGEEFVEKNPEAAARVISVNNTINDQTMDELNIQFFAQQLSTSNSCAEVSAMTLNQLTATEELERAIIREVFQFHKAHPINGATEQSIKKNGRICERFLSVEVLQQLNAETQAAMDRMSTIVTSPVIEALNATITKSSGTLTSADQCMSHSQRIVSDANQLAKALEFHVRVAVATPLTEQKK